MRCGAVEVGGNSGMVSVTVRVTSVTIVDVFEKNIELDALATATEKGEKVAKLLATPVPFRGVNLAPHIEVSFTPAP